MVVRIELTLPNVRTFSALRVCLLLLSRTLETACVVPNATWLAGVAPPGNPAWRTAISTGPQLQVSRMRFFESSSLTDLIRKPHKCIGYATLPNSKVGLSLEGALTFLRSAFSCVRGKCSPLAIEMWGK